MTISRIQFVDGVSRSGAGLNTSADLTSVSIGHTLVAYLRWADTAQNFTSTPVTCTGESNLTSLGSIIGPGPNGTYGQWFILNAATAAGAKTVACTPVGSGANSVYCISVWQLSGATGADGAPVNASGSGTTPSVGKTTSLSNAAMLAVIRSDIGSDMSAPGSGYTEETTLINLFGPDSAEYNLNVGAAGAKTVNATIPSGAWMIDALAISSADGVAGSTELAAIAAVLNGFGINQQGIRR